jgi:hypothetical protein
MSDLKIPRPLSILLALGALLPLVAPSSALATPPRDLLPDLAQGDPTGVATATDPAAPTKFRLIFNSAVANVGNGPLVIVGQRTRGAKTMTAHQVVKRSDGSSRTRSASAGTLMYVHEPDHQHWHLLAFERYELWSSGARTIVRRDRKQGFCLGDRYVLSANKRIKYQPLHPVYTGFCGKNRPDLTRMTEGIDVGWGDDYTANLEGQFIDVTGVPAGRYLLVHRVNTRHELLEANPFNDVSCVPVELTWPAGTQQQPAVKVLVGTKFCSSTYNRWGVPG